MPFKAMPCRRLLSLPLCLLVSLAFLSQTALASVLAVDYGSEWIKASLMKPGVPFDVLLNRDSKRKIQSSVAWKNSDRLFGSDAANLAPRFPADSFSHLKILQGLPFGSDAVSFYSTISPAEVLETPRQTVALRTSNGTEWAVEELIGMQLAYVRELADSVGGEKVQDVIVAVPPHYSQFERDAIADAIEIAGMRMLALINDGTAVAVNFAMTRTFAAPEYHIIYDAGASSIRATVVSFVTVAGDAKSKSTTKDSTHITVAGVGFDRTAGGTELDRRLRDILVKDFEAKHKKNIRGDKKGMAKLWKEAGRVKAILSANADAITTIESVAFDIDYRSKIARSTFVEACSDLKDRFAQPITDALANSGLTLDNITSVILTGGHSRTPMVQAAVKSAVGESKIATNVNADESAVLGAAFYGASVSRQFRTKDIKVQDIATYDLQISYLAESKTADAKPKTIHTSIFPAGSKVGSKKTLTFKRKDDFTVTMAYKKSPGYGIPTDLSETAITGVQEAIGNLTERGAIDPVVRATVVLSESGFAAIESAVAFGEIKDTSITGKLKGLFGGGSSKDDIDSESSSTTDSTDATSTSESATSTSTSTSASASVSPTNEKKAADKDLNTIRLSLDVKPLAIPALSPSEKRKARDRLIAIDHAEAAKRRREDARNSLEGYLYRLRDHLEDDAQTPFMRCSKEEERSTIADKLKETLTWMHDEADDAETWTFWTKRDAIEKLERPIQHRYKEIEAFPEALNNSQKWNFATRVFLGEARANLTAEDAAGLPSKWTTEELDALEKTLKDTEAWLNEWVEKQKSVKQNEDPVILTTEMKVRAKTLETQLAKLVRRKVPKVKKPAATSATSTSEGGSSRATTAGDEPETTTLPTTPAEETQASHDEL